MDNSKLKQLAITIGGIAGSVAMILVAMALAQRDARVEKTTSPGLEFTYANRPAQGIILDTTADREGFPPAPVIRGNDSDPVATNHASRSVDPNNPFRSPVSLIRYSNQNRAATSLAEPPPLRETPPLPTTSGLLPSSPLPSSPLPSSPLPSSPLPGSSLPPLTNSPSIDELRGNMPSLVPSNQTNPINRLSDEASSIGSPVLPNNLSNTPTDTLQSPSTLPATLPRGPAYLPSSPFSQPRNTSLPADNEAIPEIDSTPSNTATARLQPPSLANPRSIASEPNFAPAPAISNPNNNFEPPPMPQSAPPSAPQSATQSMPQLMPKSDSLRGGSTERFNAPLPRESLNESMPPSNFASTSTTSQFTPLASAAPGVRHLDGSQNPSMEIQKRAPAEVQVGIPSTFTLLVRNVGNATAFDVNVHDAVPKGAKLVRTSPTAQTDPSGKLVWKLGEMKAGSEQVLTVDLVPESEGELGSVASVTFAAQASVRTMSTQPKLVVNQKANTTVLGGDDLRITIEVSNTGTGTARGVELEEDVPTNMRHSSGVSTLGLTVGDLAPGESERFEIDLMAVSAGKAINKIRAISTNSATFESSATIDVILPKLVLNVEGPRLRYLERQATYRTSVTNSGTAMAKNVELMLYLPRGMEFNSAANEGTYLPDQHAVAWSLSELSAGSSATTEVVLLPVQEGDFVLRLQGLSDGVRADAVDKKVQVEGQSELAFTIEDDNDPIETDGLTTYLIRITNTGTRMDNDIQLVIEMPDGSKSEQVNAPTNHQTSQRTIVFAPIPQMQPKDQQIYRVAVRHAKEGVLVLRAQLKSKNRPVPVVKEESTQVYLDR
ncbi:MAG: hypothetical protein LW870_19975 [Pirellula sp.]|jgi:uncharacterized repeat protein (TIGR01451 family)|nr:hypothetical protein [Pirellula sp.]